MSDLRALLNPPSTAQIDGPSEALLNPVPGRLRLPEDTAQEEAEDDSLPGIDSRQERRLHRAA